jgi:SSS family solute:Na+ symporter
MAQVYQQMPEKFDMILSPDNPSYNNLPGIWILIGAGVWIGHFAYWGFNQYITQRALGAKSLKEAQKGVMFAAYLKLLMPLIIVLPGICAAILFPVLDKTDQAYPTMMIELLPSGLLGLTFAALIAAIVSSLASMTNSISTIFTMDICRSFSKNEIQQQSLILIGRSAVVGSMLIALVMAKPILGNSDEIFQYIQNFTGLFTPGILVIFLVALFWKKATTLSVLVAAILSVVMSIFIQASFPDFPYIHRMGVVFFASGMGCYLTSAAQGYLDQEKAIDLNGINFKTSKAFNVNSLIIVSILTLIYVTLG